MKNWTDSSFSIFFYKTVTSLILNTMATKNQNLSYYEKDAVPSGYGKQVGIVVSEWNKNITGALLEGAISTLVENGVDRNDIVVMNVPGSFELIYGAAQMVKTEVDGVIAIGCVIRGDTPHDRYICQGTTYGLAHLNATQDKPVIYGLITTLDMEQAEERAGGKMGNKGVECAITLLKMFEFERIL